MYWMRKNVKHMALMFLVVVGFIFNISHKLLINSYHNFILLVSSIQIGLLQLFLSQTFPFPSFPFLLIFLYFLFSFSFFLIPFGFMLISIVHFISRNVQVMVFTHSNKPWNILKQWYVSYLHVARTFKTLSYIPLLNVLILEVIWVSLTCMLNTYWCCHLIP